MKGKQRIMQLLEAYEDKDFFIERADYLEHSRLAIRDELIV
jgi:hypothetical protein